MAFSERDISTCDPIAHIRAHPEMYMPYGQIDGYGLVASILFDVLVDRRRTVFAHRIGDWWIVASDSDWMAPASTGVSVTELFSRILPFPALGQNAMRAEVLLTAFADDVVTFDANSSCTIKGIASDAPSFIMNEHPEWKRVVAFRLA